MNPVPVDPWKNFSEDELWLLAMSRDCAQPIRDEAMLRWLFPAEFGYAWAAHRLIRLRQRLHKNSAARTVLPDPTQDRLL